MKGDGVILPTVCLLLSRDFAVDVEEGVTLFPEFLEADESH